MPRKHRRDPRHHEPPSFGAAAPRRSDPPPWAIAGGYDVRQVAGDKAYICPGCDHPVRPGLRHLVVVPVGEADERRHWHTECWRRELRRIGAYRQE